MKSYRDNHFCTKHLDANLGRRSVRGGAVTALGQGSKFLLNLASTALLARLLSPNDFGLVAMILVVTGFVQLFRDLGLTMATVQRQEITQEQVSALFWINALLGLTMAVLTAASAPLVAWFYGEPRLLGATAVVATSFVFSGLSVQHQALLTRQMRFGALAVNEVCSMAAGIATALITAKLGAGFWSLVYMQVAMAASSCVGAWVQCRWRPGPPKRAAEMRAMLAFGGHLTGFNLVNYLGRNVDQLLIGRVLGKYQLGLYSKAYQLLLLPLHQINGPMTRVAVPALSRLQNDPQRYVVYYRRAILLLCSASMPIVAFMFVTADQAIRLVLGPQWMDAVWLFQLLAPAAFIGTFNVATGWVYVSLGRTDRQLRMGLVVVAITLIGFAIGLQWGAAGVAASYSIVTCLVRYPTILYCFHRTFLRASDLLGAIWQPALVSLLAAAAVYALRAGAHGPAMPLAASFGLNMLTYGVAYALLWQALPDGRRMTRVAVAEVKQQVAKRVHKTDPLTLNPAAAPAAATSSA
ncbi:MAG: lipopolysaccharide biosynthesis protein [Tepidisphaeraceae bacterium]